MTVKDLIATLKAFHPEDLVVLAKDSEGNGFSRLESYTLDIYVEEENSFRGGEIYDREDSKDFPEGIPCITLWPVH